jgi:hypothetical protein
MMRRVSGLVASVSAMMLMLASCSNDGDVTAPGAAGAPAPTEAPVVDPQTVSDTVRRGCALPKEHLARIYQGFARPHSEDVTIVPAEPNYSGSFNVVSHSGPWDYLQTVPLVLYGPGRIAANGEIAGDAQVLDIYATVGELLGVELEQRSGVVLEEALDPQAPEAPPKLIVTLMWDGAGRNMLERWPKRWPTLTRLMEQGTSYLAANVGSSPSITPATHASAATGAYPRDHKVTAIDYRAASGKVRTIFQGRNPRDMKLTTYADQYDLLTDNQAKVGFIGWREWHMPILGHGSMTPGGDRDVLALIGLGGKVGGNDNFYRTPSYLRDKQDLFDRHVRELDLEDGEADGKWRGHEIDGEYEENPAYVRYSGDIVMTELRRGGYGMDEVPDLFLANFKQTDIAGHQYSMDSREVAEVLSEQDAQLERLVGYLDSEVGDYALILTADHGHTPAPETTGAWPINPSGLKADMDATFGVPEGETLFYSSTAVGPFLKRGLMADLNVTARQVAKFYEDYRLRDNWASGEPLPEGYEGRGNERLFAAAWAARDFPAIIECAFPEGPPTRS